MSEGVLLSERLPPGGIITLTFGKPEYKMIRIDISDETPDTVPNAEEIYEEASEVVEEPEVPSEDDIIDEDDDVQEDEDIPEET